MMRMEPIIDQSLLNEEQKDLLRDNYKILSKFKELSKEYSSGGTDTLELVFGEDLFSDIKSNKSKLNTNKV